LDSGGCGVFLGFGIIVVEIGGAIGNLSVSCRMEGLRGELQSIFWARHGCKVVLPKQKRKSPNYFINYQLASF
jgi:hypothetical protein